MNNEQFRRLVSTNTPKPSADSNGATPTPPRGAALGSRQRSSIPMTPRSVAGLHKSDFARQLAERNQPDKQQKKPRSFAPKGSKLAQGYTDRTQATRISDEEDERAARIKALEEALKKEEIDQETFDKLRFQIAGGDLSSTHLVKGLDFKLLERVRKGEDVYDEHKTEEDEDEEAGPEPEDVEGEFDRLEEDEVAAVAKEKAAKKGQLSTAPLNPSKKRTRDQVLAEMKAAREAAKAKQEESALGQRFKKIGPKTPGTRIERDSKGREVMIIVDEDGHEKRKVRKTHANLGDPKSKASDMMVPGPNAKPLGMEVPDIYKPKVEEPEDEDINIFDDVGDDYDPLAGLDEDSDEDEPADKAEVLDASKKDKDAMPPPPRPAATTERRNYFKDSKTALASSETLTAPSMSDPAIQAAFKKAATLKQMSRETDEDDEEAKAKAERHRKMLENNDRDAEDMDMGFGTSRFEDEADFDETKVKLSEWGRDGDEDDTGGKGGGAKRKRGGKKRKGDANNAADVLRVMEKQKADKAK
ncbi:Uu.00g038980.m01.CDS01 [Anthostomella pinea]|uniref:Uu.00g038980.m01.CDS01 n=1 Tax=Anthostomella pinea TaxID=933095 RepID=A0AAI8YDS6_9PEZI|nr:Uu.00g038980.m01.CDS01 [Anthostomella pinea]